MSTVPKGSQSAPGDPDHEIFDMQALRDNGLVWAINRYVLHPRGLAMWMHAVPAGVPEDEQHAAGWGIARADDGIWSFDADIDILGRDKFDAFVAYVHDRAITDAAAVDTEPLPRPWSNLAFGHDPPNLSKELERRFGKEA